MDGEKNSDLLVIVKKDCPTCVMLEPLLSKLSVERSALTIASQDVPDFPNGVDAPHDDRSLEMSYRYGIEIVPTLIRLNNGVEVGRVEGWHKEDWRQATGIEDLGSDLPDMRPGCGSLSVAPGMADTLAIKYGGIDLRARHVEVSAYDDEMEASFERGWTDGLPVVPPTPVRVYRMLQGTDREPQELVGHVPPDVAPCTIEKIAINAVMAGCKPEYLPTVIAAVEAALQDEFCLHGLLCTTMFSSPVIIANGPESERIGMNGGLNALGQGNRANATIGRALQLVVRNVGGGRPGEIDRATLGNPGKYTYCFAESDELGDWSPLSEQRGFSAEQSTVTLFAGHGLEGIVDQKSRTPESLVRSFAAKMLAVNHPKLALAGDAVIIVCPEHHRVFRDAGWSKERVLDELTTLLTIPADEILAGVDGIDEGLPTALAGKSVSKFRQDGLLIVKAGGQAGMFSAIIPGWLASGEIGSIPVTRAIG